MNPLLRVVAARPDLIPTGLLERVLRLDDGTDVYASAANGAEDELRWRERAGRLTIDGPDGMVSMTAENTILGPEVRQVLMREVETDLAAPLWASLDEAGWAVAARLAEQEWDGTSTELAATASAIAGRVSGLTDRHRGRS